MEILIGILGIGFLALIGAAVKFTSDEAKQGKSLEDSRMRKITELEAQLGGKEEERNKLMDKLKKTEEDFFKTKDDIDIFKKENSELALKIKQLEKSKDETAPLKNLIKEKDLLFEQERVARQKLEGEFAIMERELGEVKKDRDAIKERFEGLKGQYDELSAELEKNVAQKIQKKEPLENTGEAPETAAKEDEAKKEVPFEKDKKEAAAKESPGPEKPQKRETAAAGAEEIAGAQPEKPREGMPDAGAIPGFPKKEEVKVEIKKDVPKDTDFLKAQSPKRDPDKAQGAGAKKDVSPELAKEKEKVEKQQKPSGEAKEKNPKKETLIPGFRPKSQDVPESESDKQK